MFYSEDNYEKKKEGYITRVNTVIWSLLVQVLDLGLRSANWGLLLHWTWGEMWARTRLVPMPVDAIA